MVRASSDARQLTARCVDRLGDRVGAVKLYEDFVARLRADLDVEPSAETVSLVNAIRPR